MSRGFAGVPRIVMESEDYMSLSGNSVKLLLQLCYQYRGENNGDLMAAESVLLKRGFNSKTTIRKALRELIEKRLVMVTRQGRFQNPGGVCSLYAVTWQSIDECNGKLDVKPTRTAPRNFALERHKFNSKKQNAETRN